MSATLTLLVVAFVIGYLVGRRNGIRRAEWGIALANAKRGIENRAFWRQ